MYMLRAHFFDIIVRMCLLSDFQFVADILLKFVEYNLKMSSNFSKTGIW